MLFGPLALVGCGSVIQIIHGTINGRSRKHHVEHSSLLRVSSSFHCAIDVHLRPKSGWRWRSGKFYQLGCCPAKTIKGGFYCLPFGSRLIWFSTCFLVGYIKVGWFFLEMSLPLNRHEPSYIAKLPCHLHFLLVGEYTTQGKKSSATPTKGTLWRKHARMICNTKQKYSWSPGWKFVGIARVLRNWLTCHSPDLGDGDTAVGKFSDSAGDKFLHLVPLPLLYYRWWKNINESRATMKWEEYSHHGHISTEDWPALDGSVNFVWPSWSWICIQRGAIQSW